MPNFAMALREEIVRIAKKQCRSEVAGMRKANLRYRGEIADLKRRLQSAEKLIVALKKERVPSVSIPAQETESLVGVRFSGRSLRAQRERLGMTREQLAPLMEISMATLYKWEKGVTRPGKKHIEAWVRLRNMSKADIAPYLARLEK